MPPLFGRLVVDLTRYLPGGYAGRELRRLGARVVRIEPPDGDLLRETARAWDRVLNAGKESVVCDLKSEEGLALARALLMRADVVLEGFRPGVAARLGVGPEDVRANTVYCSITGFGVESAHDQRAAHDLNYLGWAGVLADTAPGMPPLQIADLAAGALGAVTRILAALLEGGGARITVSMAHRAHDLVAHRVGEDTVPKLLTGGVACYHIYETADGRFLTVAALEPKFWQRLCERLDLPGLVGRQWEPRLPELERAFTSRSLAEWLEFFDREDVCVGPVSTLEEAAKEFSNEEDLGPPPYLGEHTEAWRTTLGL